MNVVAIFYSYFKLSLITFHFWGIGKRTMQFKGYLVFQRNIELTTSKWKLKRIALPTVSGAHSKNCKVVMSNLRYFETYKASHKETRLYFYCRGRGF